MTDCEFSENMVTTAAQLGELYCKPGWIAQAAESDVLIPAYRAFIEASPYLTIASNGPEGPDCSPRGDAPGFVKVSDDRTLLIPDRAGNNRIDTLRNIMHDQRIALHFLVPGCAESLRIKGTASICSDPNTARGWISNGKTPRTFIVVEIRRAFFHCGKAARRGKLWDRLQAARASSLAGANGMLAAVQWRRFKDAILGRSSQSGK